MTRYEFALKEKYALECQAGRHRWITDGGRPCPKGSENCSQTVYQCFWCSQYDYGQKDGPGYEDCKNCTAFSVAIDDYKHDILETVYQTALHDLMKAEDKVFSS